MSLFGKPEHRQCDCAKLAVVKPSLTRADGKERKVHMNTQFIL